MFNLHTNLAVCLCLTGFISGDILAQQTIPPHVKVHKPFITVSAPAEDGKVAVVGLPGAIETTSPVVLQLSNLATDMMVVMTMADDGSFAGQIAAETGQQVRVLARNREGRRSYGTFTVPATTRVRVAVPVTAPPPAAPLQDEDPIEDTPPPAADTSDIGDGVPEAGLLPTDELPSGMVPGSGRLAVTIIVLDTETGQVLSSGAIAGQPRGDVNDADSVRAAAQETLLRCLRAARSILRPSPGAIPDGPAAGSGITLSRPEGTNIYTHDNPLNQE